MKVTVIVNVIVTQRTPTRTRSTARDLDPDIPTTITTSQPTSPAAPVSTSQAPTGAPTVSARGKTSRGASSGRAGRVKVRGGTRVTAVPPPSHPVSRPNTAVSNTTITATTTTTTTTAVITTTTPRTTASTTSPGTFYGRKGGVRVGGKGKAVPQKKATYQPQPTTSHASHTTDRQTYV